MAWSLKRNCSVTPAQLGGFYAVQCAVSLSVAGVLWLHGAPLVLPFALLELAGVGAAFLVYARHAADGERIYLLGSRLVVEQEIAGRVQRCEFAREWVQIESQSGADWMIELRGGGQVVRLGRSLRPELRPVLAREIRQAVRGA